MGKPVTILEVNADPCHRADDEGSRHSAVVPSEVREHRPTVRVPAYLAPLDSEVRIREVEPAVDEDESLIDEGWTGAEAVPSLRPSARPTFHPSLRPTLRVPETASPAARKSDAAQRRAEGGYSQVVVRRRST